MRLVSLLPSATDIIAALHADAALVGVSHSCDARWAHLPKLTSTRINKNAPAAEIDQQVKSTDAPLYQLDTELLNQLAPDIIISQDLCDVCAVSGADVTDALTALNNKPQLITLSPFRLDDVVACFMQVAEAIGRVEEGVKLQKRWQENFAACRERFADAAPKIAFLDWLAPPFAAGHWMPDMIEWTGCQSVLAQAGEKSHEITWDDVRAAAPDIVLAACCGQDAQTAEQARANVPGDIDIEILDGDALFSRPSPSLMDAVHIFTRAVDEKLAENRFKG